MPCDQLTYDSMNRMTSVTGLNGDVTRYTYDGLNGDVTRYTYDAAGRRIEPASSTLTTAYS